MTALNNRSSVCAIVEEVTEGTPVSPTSATDDYIALQDGFSITPAFEELTNDRLINSLAQAKSILGLESPTSTISHYWVASGTAGTESNHGLFIESFLGGKTVNGTEYDTVGGSTAGDASTRATIVVDAGEGAQFRDLGHGLLIKDGVNGFRVRNTQSISTDTLSLNFNLPAAPASGVNLGQAVLFYPTTEGHPTFTTWVYRSNGGAVEMMSGSRVSTMTMTADAGQLINCEYALAGIEYYFNPIEITSSDIYLDFTSDNGTFAAQVTAQMYKDPVDLANALATAMESVDSAESYEVTYSSSTGKYTIASSTSALLSLLWNTGTNTANTIGDKLGFDIAADDTGATSYEADNVIDITAPQTPSYDSTDPNVGKANEVTFGDFDDYVCFNASNVTMNGTNTVSNLLSLCATSGREGTLITARATTFDVTARLTQYDADKFFKFRTNANVQFMYNNGEKSGGNWTAGTVKNIYAPFTTITSYEVVDTDGVLELQMTLSTYTPNGEEELFVNEL